MRDIAGLARNLGHHHQVARGVTGGERRQPGRQLIAQNQDQPRCHHGTGVPAQSKKRPV
jgi:hypothetical protein